MIKNSQKALDVLKISRGKWMFCVSRKVLNILDCAVFINCRYQKYLFYLLLRAVCGGIQFAK